MKNLLYLALLLLFSTSYSQKLEKLQWFNEPDFWEIKNNTLFMKVTEKTDYWRKTHYDFIVDDAPFAYAVYGGEFEVKVKISGNYKTTFDQMGLMLRQDHENWIKTGIEFVNGKQNISTVVTHQNSDWSVIELNNAPKFIWIKAVRKLDAVEIFYSYNDKEYTMMRTCFFKDNMPVQVGLMAASPDGNGFDATFENFKVTKFPDSRRLEWAKKQQ